MGREGVCTERGGGREIGRKGEMEGGREGAGGGGGGGGGGGERGERGEREGGERGGGGREGGREDLLLSISSGKLVVQSCVHYYVFTVPAVHCCQ